MKKIILIIVITLSAIVLIIVGRVVFKSIQVSNMSERYQQVEVGMTESEVIVIMGKPTQINTGPGLHLAHVYWDGCV